MTTAVAATSPAMSELCFLAALRPASVTLRREELREQELQSFRDHGCRCHEPSDVRFAPPHSQMSPVFVKLRSVTQDLARQGLVMAPQQWAGTSPWCWWLVPEYFKSIR
ncbi:hypothetical protein PCH_Pc24g02920 [Penicillium rubens Wisconsin 54-1255]|uniref:Uncharacterized protein n=1 Tax=Penicillium rubens (strain ATCC 28089 / DSM 1075 / NRRL 1951 / Wisconsin 54-1255) TaxID=500485 RepID=B6HX60_PENRW|nr:hypothetical protein PCH_Pc24g02920 [Penicillium rubens Wisconsin 54-1255]